VESELEFVLDVALVPTASATALISFWKFFKLGVVIFRKINILTLLAVIKHKNLTSNAY
jgi:hypothetical protein